jgi:drug/metabolite transporter (DMT)-like permease
MSAADLSLAAPARTLDPTLRGVLCMLAAMACFVTNDTLTKLTAVHLPASEIMVLRGVIATGAALAVIRATGLHRRLGALAHPVVIVRSVLEALISVCFLTALARMRLAEITTVLQATPLILTVLTVLVHKQTVGRGAWLAVAVGFAGVMLVMRPSVDGLTLDAGLALLCAALIAVRDLITRSIPSSAPSLVVTLAAIVAMVVIGGGLGAAEPGAWAAPSTADVARMTAAAGLIIVGNIWLIMAFRSGDVSVVGPLRYSVIVWSMLLGFAVWGDRPDAFAILGAFLIVGSGLHALRQERTRRRSAATSGKTPLALPARAGPARA